MRVLIIGLGSIAKKHINALLTIDRTTEIYALRSSFNANQEENVTNVYSLDFLSTKPINFIIISTPTFLHHKNIVDLLDYNIPLFIEKPLSDNLKIKELVFLVKERNLRTYVACNLRFLDALNYVKNEILDSNSIINEVNVYCGSYLPNWRPLQNFRQSYSANPLKGGGVHLDVIHELDYLYWLFGRPNHSSKILRSQSSLGIDSVDFANYILEYNGFAASVVLNYYRIDTKRTLEMVMNDETILVDIINNTVYKNNELIYQSRQNILDTYTLQLKYFFDKVLSSNEKAYNDINEAFEVLKICLA